MNFSPKTFFLNINEFQKTFPSLNQSRDDDKNIPLYVIYTIDKL